MNWLEFGLGLLGLLVIALMAIPVECLYRGIDKLLEDSDNVEDNSKEREK